MDDNSSTHYTAVVTPFDEDGAVDTVALRALCEHLIEVPGITGLVANANAAEVDALSQDERRTTLRVTAEVAHAAKKTVIGGLAPVPSSFSGAVANAREFTDDGADSLLVLGPTAFARGIHKDPQLAGEYVSRIYEAVHLPIIYFLAGSLSGINYTSQVIAEICKADGVVAVKDTMWSTEGFASTKRTIEEINPSVKVLTGNDNCVFGTLREGAVGTLLILNCLAGAEIVAMDRAVRTNNLQQAREIDTKIGPLVDAMFQPPMLKMASRAKAALELKGVLANSFTRLPVPTLTGTERLELESALRKSGQL